MKERASLTCTSGKSEEGVNELQLAVDFIVSVRPAHKTPEDGLLALLQVWHTGSSVPKSRQSDLSRLRESVLVGIVCK